MSYKTIYKGSILTLSKIDDFWEVVEHASTICVLALKKDKVLGVKQMRPAVNTYTWELPAGIIDAGETPEEAARRELAEEVQLTGELTLITQMYSSPGFCNEETYLFEATNLKTAKGKPDEHEKLSISWSKLDKVWQAIQQGKLKSSSATLLGLSYALGKKGYFSEE